MKTFMDQLNQRVKHWWVSLILGILYIVLAFWLISNPLASFFVLSIVFSIFMFVSGLFEILFAVGNKEILPNWGLYFTGGMIDLLMGGILLISPGLSMVVLPFILAFWLMFRGFSGVGSALELRRYGSRHWGWYLCLAILVIYFAFSIVWLPAAGAITFVFITACTFLAIGVFRFFLAFGLRKLKKREE